MTTDVCRKDLQLSALIISLFIVSCFIISWPIFWNKFPILYFDDSYYLSRAFIGRPTFDRPIYYSYFLYLFHLFPFGLYIAAAVQVIITVALIMYFLALILPFISAAFLTSLFCCVIAVTPTTFYIVTLMPDITVLWLALSAAIGLVSRGILALCVATLVTIVSIAVHNGTLLIFLCLCPALIFLSVIMHSSWRMISYICATGIAVLFLGIFNNWLAGLGPLEKPTTFFLAGRLNQGKALTKSFEELARDEKRIDKRAVYDLWAKRTQELIPELEALLWNGESILNETFPKWYDDISQYRAAQEILGPVVTNALRRHSDIFLQTAKHNLTSMMVGEYSLAVMAFNQDEPAYKALEKFWPGHISYCQISRQMAGDVDAKKAFPSILQIWKNLMRASLYTSPLFAALLAAAILIFGRRVTRSGFFLSSSAVFMIVFFANVVVCSVFTSGATRFAERGFALFPLSILLFVFALFAMSRTKTIFADDDQLASTA
jgi:hypothetical protein